MDSRYNAGSPSRVPPFPLEIDDEMLKYGRPEYSSSSPYGTGTYPPLRKSPTGLTGTYPPHKPKDIVHKVQFQDNVGGSQVTTEQGRYGMDSHQPRTHIMDASNQYAENHATFPDQDYDIYLSSRPRTPLTTPVSPPVSRRQMTSPVTPLSPQASRRSIHPSGLPLSPQPSRRPMSPSKVPSSPQFPRRPATFPGVSVSPQISRRPMTFPIVPNSPTLSRGPISQYGLPVNSPSSGRTSMPSGNEYKQNSLRSRHLANNSNHLVNSAGMPSTITTGIQAGAPSGYPSHLHPEYSSSKHQYQIPPAQKNQPPGTHMHHQPAGITSPSFTLQNSPTAGKTAYNRQLSEGLFPYPKRQEAHIQPEPSTQSLDRPYQQPSSSKPQYYYNHNYMPNQSASLPRSPGSFPITLEPSERNQAGPLYKKHQEGLAEHTGSLHKHSQANSRPVPSVQTYPDHSGGTHYTQPTQYNSIHRVPWPGNTDVTASTPQSPSPFRKSERNSHNKSVSDNQGYNPSISNSHGAIRHNSSAVSTGYNPGHLTLPASVKVSGGSGKGSDSVDNTGDDQRNSIYDTPTSPVIQRQTRFQQNISQPRDAYQQSPTSHSTSQQIQSFNSNFPSPTPKRTGSTLGSWPFGDFQKHIMSNQTDSMKAMEENMKKMQKHMEEQFQNFNLAHPPNMAMPGNFPPMMETMKLPEPPIGIPGFPQPMIPIPGFTPQSSHPPAQTGAQASSGLPLAGPSGGQSTPASIMTSGPSGTANNSKALLPTVEPTNNVELSRTIQNTPDGNKHLQLSFDMHDFAPEEITVKKDKNKLEVNAYHEEKEPNRVACKVFQQQYHLPKNVRLAKMEYDIDPSGTLTVKSPVKPRQNVKFAPDQNLEQTKLLYPEPHE